MAGDQYFSDELETGAFGEDEGLGHPSTPQSDGFQQADATLTTADDDFGVFEAFFDGNEEAHEHDATVALLTSYDSQPVGPAAVLLQNQDEWPFNEWGDHYEEPLLNDLEWSGPIQPNAPPEIFRNDELLLEQFDPAAVDEETLDWDAQPVGLNAVRLQYFGEDAEAWHDDQDELWFEFDAAPVGANSSVAQYFGEDAEAPRYEDENSSDDPPQDELPQTPPLLAQYYGEDAETADELGDEPGTGDGYQQADPDPSTFEDNWPHFDDEGWLEEFLDELAQPPPPVVQLLQYFGEDAESTLLDEIDEGEPPQDDVLQQAPATVQPLQYFGEEAEGWHDDQDEPWLDFEGTPAGAAGVFAQYFGEDSESELLDDATDEETLDTDGPPVVANVVVILPQPPDDAWDWSADEVGDEQLPDESSALPEDPPPEDTWPHFDDATDEDLLAPDEVPQTIVVVVVQPPPADEVAPYLDDDFEDFGADHFGNADTDPTQIWDDWPHWDDEGYAEDLAAETTDSYALINFVPLPPLPPEDAWPHWDDEGWFEDLAPETTDAFALVDLPPVVPEDAWPHHDDTSDEETLDFDSQPVGVSATFAQYFGEDAELGQPDDTIEVDAPLDDYLQGFAPIVTPDQHFGEDAEIWFDDPDEEPFEHYLTQPVGAAAVFAQYYGDEAEQHTLHDEQGEEILDTDQALGANAPQIDTSQLGGHEWQQDDDELEDWALLSLDAQVGANAGGAAIDDAWDHFADESLEEFLPPEESQIVVLVTQPPEDGWEHWSDETFDDFAPPPDPAVAPPPSPISAEDAWDWSADETLEETLDFFDQPTGASARFAQYFGEDAETAFLEDESSTEELVLDVLPPPPLLFPSNDIVFYIPQLAVAYTAQGEVLYISQNQVVYMPMSPQLQKFRPKLPSEEQVLTFNMAAALTGGNLLQGTPTVVSVTSVRGDDPTPNAILNGPPALDVTQQLILVPVKGGVPNSSYIIEVNCATQQADVQPSLAAILPIGYP